MALEKKNPSTCFMQWEGSTGRFKWWNNETKSDVYLESPFTFVVLDELITVKGWYDNHNSGIWSNEVRKLQDSLIVHTREGVLANGKYKDIKRKVNGLKYCQSIYIAFKNEKQELVLGNLQLKGSALSAWFDFVGEQKLVGKAVSFKGVVRNKKGSNEYFSPVFEQRKIAEETIAKAREIYQNLQGYLGEYLLRNKGTGAAQGI